METKDLESNLTYEILPEEYSYYDLTFKLIVIGDSFVGKSCLTNRATKNTFEDNYSATVGFEFVTANIKINDKVCKMQIWDTCGQEVYRSLITSFYRNSSLAVLVYSIDNHESYDNLDLWLKELKTFSSPDAKIFLIGNKADLESKRVIEKEAGERFMKENGLNYFSEASAKTGFNSQKIFIEAAKVLYVDWIKYHKDKRQSDVSYTSGSISSSVIKTQQSGNNINLTNSDKKEKEKGCAC